MTIEQLDAEIKRLQEKKKKDAQKINSKISALKAQRIEAENALIISIVKNSKLDIDEIRDVLDTFSEDKFESKQKGEDE